MKTGEEKDIQDNTPDTAKLRRSNLMNSKVMDDEVAFRRGKQANR